jgi:hypothetical protein
MLHSLRLKVKASPNDCMSKPIHRISLPSHHPAVNDMDDDDTVLLHAKPVPPPKPMKSGGIMGEMPHANADGERPMPLTREFDVVHMERMAPKAKGGQGKRPTKGGALEYMKERQTKEAYEGGTKPVT